MTAAAATEWTAAYTANARPPAATAAGHVQTCAGFEFKIVGKREVQTRVGRGHEIVAHEHSVAVGDRGIGGAFQRVGRANIGQHVIHVVRVGDEIVCVADENGTENHIQIRERNGVCADEYLRLVRDGGGD